MSDFMVGDTVSAEVTKVATYGVVIKFCNQKGFIQIPELSWDTFALQKRVSSICKVGDIIRVKILSQTDEQFYASVRAVSSELDPWNAQNRPVVGEKLRGEVVAVAEYGYLIKLPSLALSVLPTAATNKEFKQGQKASFRVASVDTEKQKVLLECQ